MAQRSLSGPDDRRLACHQQRWELLDHLHALIEKPLAVLSLVWLALVVINLTSGLTGWLNVAQYALWALFIFDFLVEFWIAPHKRTYLKRHWLVAISLALPAFSMLRFFIALRLLRAAGTVESFDLVRVLASVNRGMGLLNRTIGRRGVGYVAGLTTIVVFVGAAGMLTFESQTALRQAGHAAAVSQGAGFRNYGDAVWWTAMIMTTMGSQYWPITAAGRVLCFLLSLYAFAVFGYLTATIATLFIGHDSEQAAAQQQRVQSENTRVNVSADDELRQEITALREQVALLTGQLAASPLLASSADGQRTDSPRPPATQERERDAPSPAQV